MIPSAQSSFNRIKGAINEARDITQVPKWITDNTRHPADPRKPFSFVDHEYQVDILSDPARDLVVVKCSQIGMSEVQVRWVMAMLSIYQPTTAIYSLPTDRDAQHFTKTRMDTLIEQSEFLRALVRNDADSASLKRLGMSFLHTTGTYGKSATISIPAQIVISDEIDFSRQRALQQLESRLGHGEEGKFRRFFSTPTLPGFGISRLYDKSSRGRYKILHGACGEWVAPVPLEDVLVPAAGLKIPEPQGARPRNEVDDRRLVKQGNAFPLQKLDADMVSHDRVDPAGTVLLCPHCRHVIPFSDFGDPGKRKWAHDRPEVARRGYQVYPFDVPRIKPLGRAVRSLQNFETLNEFLNFEWGEAYRDAASSISPAALNQAFTLAPLAGPSPRPPCYIGVDVGKTSWLVVLEVKNGKHRIIWYERIAETGKGELLNTVVDRALVFQASRLIIDASPDFSTSSAVAEKLPGRGFACFYVNDKLGVLGNLEVKEADRTVRAYRTRSLDRMVAEINAGKWEFARQPGLDVVLRSHLQSLEKVVDRETPGKKVERWGHSGDDHFAHACNYARLAEEMDGVGSMPAAPSMFDVAKARFGRRGERLQVSWVRGERDRDILGSALRD